MNHRVVLGVMGLTGAVIVLGQVGVDAFPGTGSAPDPGLGSAPSSGDFVAEPIVSGPDVTVSRLGLDSSSSTDDFHYYGADGGIRAFSVATTSCNLGDETAEWVSGSQGNHPVIAQHVYRLLDGKFEQIGQSWLKHSFCAVSEFTCGACEPTNCDTLGIGCADTYWATLNDGASGGPKYQINPQGTGSGGTHVHPYDSPSGPGAIRGRLQIKDTDIQAGGRFFAEAHYVTHDEPAANRWNNASWREVNLSLTNMSGVEPGQDSVRLGESAIKAWVEIDPTVAIANITLNDKGRFHLGYKVTDNGDGTWSYEYALHNLNSNRGAGSFSLPLPNGVNVLGTGFHDVDYHSGDGLNGVDRSGVDWPSSTDGGTLSWATEAYADNPNANAIMWGTLYNFRFTADAPPTTGLVEIGLFTPGEQTSKTVTAMVPSEVTIDCPQDVDGDGMIGFTDLLDVLSFWGPCPGGCAQDIDGDEMVGFTDLLEVLSFWGPCP